MRKRVRELKEPQFVCAQDIEMEIVLVGLYSSLLHYISLIIKDVKKKPTHQQNLIIFVKIKQKKETFYESTTKRKYYDSDRPEIYGSHMQQSLLSPVLLCLHFL